MPVLTPNDVLYRDRTELVFTVCDLSMKLHSLLNAMLLLGVTLHEVTAHGGDFDVCDKQHCKAIQDLIKLHQPA